MIRKTSHGIAVLAILLALCACGGQVNLKEYRTLEIRPVEGGEPQTDAILYQGVPLRTGQVIVSDGGSALGFMMELMAEDYSPYVHAGVVSIEGNKAFVYEAVATLGLRFWTPPTTRMKGRIRRVTLSDYLERQSVASIYQHEKLELDRVAKFARLAYQEGLPFDGYFDYRSNDAVYCTEFVAQALVAGGSNSIRPTPRSDNLSLNRAMAWLMLDTPAFILPSDVLAGSKRIALLSHHFSAAQIKAGFIYKKELHRRFSDNQSLGNIFKWTALGPKLRPHLNDLYLTLMDGAGSADDPEPWVRQRINEKLGKYPPARMLRAKVTQR